MSKEIYQTVKLNDFYHHIDNGGVMINFYAKSFNENKDNHFYIPVIEIETSYFGYAHLSSKLEGYQMDSNCLEKIGLAFIAAADKLKELEEKITWQFWTIEHNYNMKPTIVYYPTKFLVTCDSSDGDRIDKEFSIGKFKLYKFIDVVKDELDKCDVLCSNCHREEHHRLNNLKC